MIRKALGLGLLILILKFLLKDVFVAGSGAAVSLLNSANAIFSKIGSGSLGAPNPIDLVPR